MTLNSLLKVILDTRYAVIRDEAHLFDTWHIDYTNREDDRHYECLHYIGSKVMIPKEILSAKVRHVSVNKATGKLDICVE